MESSRTSLASRTSSRTHFEVFGHGLEASSPQKLPCPRLEDSTIFWTVKIFLESARNLAENLRRPFFVFLYWKLPEKKFLKTFFAWKKFWRLFFLISFEKNFSRRSFFWRALAPVSLVLGLERVYPWPWPRNFFVSLALASSLVSSTPPLLFEYDTPEDPDYGWYRLPRMAIRYVTVRRYGYGKVGLHLNFCYEVRYAGTVHLFCNSTGTVHWYGVWIENPRLFAHSVQLFYFMTSCPLKASHIKTEVKKKVEAAKRYLRLRQAGCLHGCFTICTVYSYTHWLRLKT